MNENTKLQPGDRVRIKNLKWYEKCKDIAGNVDIPLANGGREHFTSGMMEYCGRTLTILRMLDPERNTYSIEEDGRWYNWSPKMFVTKEKPPKEDS